MSLSSTIPRISALGNGATAVYPWAWLIDTDTDLHVAVLAPPVAPATQGVLTILQIGVDFIIQNPALMVGNSNGGNIVLLGTGFLAPSGGFLPGGWGIVIRRAVTFGQPAVLNDQGSYDASSIEDALDYLAMQTLQLQDAVNHCIQTPLDDYSVPQQNIGLARTRAGGYVIFDAHGNPYSTPAVIQGVPAGGETVTGIPAVAIENLAEGLSDLVNQTLGLTSTDGITYSWNVPYGIYAGMLATAIWPETSTVTNPVIASNIYYQLPNPPPILSQSIVNKDGSALTVGQLVAGTASLLFYDGAHWRVMA